MGTNIFLGKPPANIEQWIRDHHGPVVKETTVVKFSSWSGRPDWESDIVGELTQSSIEDSTPDKAEIAEVEIGSHVTSIGQYVFSGCGNLERVTIPNSVTNIGDFAFESCDKLASMTIGNGVTSIGGSAFNGCTKLTGELKIPERVTSIGYWAFAYCSGLTSVTIPSSVTGIGFEAFKYCSGLESVTFEGKTIAQI